MPLVEINGASSGPHWLPIVSVFVSLIAIIVTSGIAIYGILDARGARRAQRQQSLQNAAVSVSLALSHYKYVLEDIQKAQDDEAIIWEFFSAIVGASNLIIQQALAKDIPDEELHSIAISIQTICNSHVMMINAGLSGGGVKTMGELKIAVISLVRAEPEISHRLDKVLARLNIRKPSILDEITSEE